MVKVLRIALMSVAGTAQFMLVMGGCLFYRNILAETFPDTRYLEKAIPLVGLYSLLWPVYASLGMRTSKSQLQQHIGHKAGQS